MIISLFCMLGLFIGFVTAAHAFYSNIKILLDDLKDHCYLYAALNEKFFLIMKEVDKYIIYKSDKNDQHNQSTDTKD